MDPTLPFSTRVPIVRVQAFQPTPQLQHQTPWSAVPAAYTFNQIQRQTWFTFSFFTEFPQTLHSEFCKTIHKQTTRGVVWLWIQHFHLAPECLLSGFRHSSQLHSYNTRHHDLLCLLLTHSTKYKGRLGSLFHFSLSFHKPSILNFAKLYTNRQRVEWSGHRKGIHKHNVSVNSSGAHPHHPRQLQGICTH